MTRFNFGIFMVLLAVLFSVALSAPLEQRDPRFGRGRGRGGNQQVGGKIRGQAGQGQGQAQKAAAAAAAASAAAASAAAAKATTNNNNNNANAANINTKVAPATTCNQARSGFVAQLANAKTALASIVADQDPTDGAGAQLITDVGNAINLAQEGVDAITTSLQTGQAVSQADNDDIISGLSSAQSAVRQIKTATVPALAADIKTFQAAVTNTQNFAAQSATLCVAGAN